MVGGKPWGKSERLHLDESAQLERITVVRGGYSSRHEHARKYNGFFIVSGLLKVREFVPQPDGGERMESLTILSPGESHVVPPGVRHQFVAETDVLAYEFYWVALGDQPLCADDIQRFSENGTMPPGPLIDVHWTLDCPVWEPRELCCKCSGKLNANSPGYHLVHWERAVRAMCWSCQRETAAEIIATSQSPGVQG